VIKNELMVLVLKVLLLLPSRNFRCFLPINFMGDDFLFSLIRVRIRVRVGIRIMKIQLDIFCNKLYLLFYYKLIFSGQGSWIEVPHNLLI